jgi:hypothetical protein
MFVYRYYDYKDIYNCRHSGYEVGFICTEWDDLKQRNTSKFCTVRTFTDETEAAEYVHWLNGGMSYKYDNVRTKN